MANNKMIEMEYTEGTPMGRVKEFLRENYEEGCLCPACNQTVKLYKRKLTANMVLPLLMIYKNGNGYVHVIELLRDHKLPDSRDWALLRHWGLISEKPKDTEDGKKSTGYWCITERGKRFARNEIELPESCNMYNKQIYGFALERINIRQAIANKFDYDELMNS